jgi:hypothetical protein
MVCPFVSQCRRPTYSAARGFGRLVEIGWPLLSERRERFLGFRGLHSLAELPAFDFRSLSELANRSLLD